jgi:hypothetical protein
MGEVLSTTNYLQNRSPTKVIPHGKTCIEIWTRKKPNLSHLKIFGSKAFCIDLEKSIEANWIITLLIAHFLGIVMKAKPSNS